MRALVHRHPVSSRRLPRAAGFATFLIALMLLLVGGAVLVSGLTGSGALEQRLAKGDSADQRLSTARAALIGFAVGNIADSGRPGQLPAPDTLQDGDYDGMADNGGCLNGAAPPHGLPAQTASSANFRCLGRLPWRTLGLSNEGVDEFDQTGLIPWYAVSANLSANNACLGHINPQTLAATPVSFVCPSNSAPPYPWLKVCDQTGRLLSDRVAFVLIVPGPPIVTEGRTQSRAGTPRPQPRDYLDAIALPANWSSLPANERCTAYDNAGLTNEFVTADAVAGFNDRLLYVTVDELSARLELRVAQQVREALIDYETAHGRYPWLAPIGNPSSVQDAFVAAEGTLSGFPPFHAIVPGYRFKTELTWAIPSSADTVSPATSSSPSFLCFGGIFQCRIRTSPAGAAIPRTVTTSDFEALKSSSVTTASVACGFTSTAVLDCDAYSFTQTSSVTYDVQIRFCCSGTYAYYDTYPGTQTRTVTIGPLSVSAAGTPPAASAGADGMMRRSLTTANASTFGMLSAVDRWSPASLGTFPFDQVGSFPLQTGSASTNGSAVSTFTNVRLYPLMPTWYVNEKWYESMTVALSPDAAPSTGGHACSANCLAAGVRTGVHAAIVAAGAALAAQNRYSGSPSIGDFLEAPNATGASTRVFADPSASSTSTYADTVLTIPR
jgi:hypothetical protein